MVYSDYISQCPYSYKPSPFLVRFKIYMGTSKPFMRVPRKVVDKLFMNFKGQKFQVVDQQTGEVQDIEVFVAIFGCSQLTYVTAVASQKNLISRHVCLHNLVRKNKDYQEDINTNQS